MELFAFGARQRQIVTSGDPIQEGTKGRSSTRSGRRAHCPPQNGKVDKLPVTVWRATAPSLTSR